MLSDRRIWRLCSFSALAVALILSSDRPALAQSPTPTAPHSVTNAQAPGTLTGTVVDPTGAVSAGAPITTTRSGPTPPPLTITSDAQGNFNVASLPPGTYTAAAAAPGFR